MSSQLHFFRKSEVTYLCESEVRETQLMKR